MPSSGTINIDLKNIIRYGYSKDGKSGILNVLRLKIGLLKDKRFCIQELKKKLINTAEDFCVVFGEKSDFVKGELLDLILHENDEEQLLDKFLLGYLFFLNRVSDDKGNDKGKFNGENELIEQVICYLKSCPINELKMATAESLAEKFNVTREHLSRCFKQYDNCSLSGRVLKIRLDRVLAILQEGVESSSIKFVASSVGFTNYARFKKQFLNRFGFPPCIVKKK
jgi:AraC-like DNA-binding protein